MEKSYTLSRSHSIFFLLAILVAGFHVNATQLSGNYTINSGLPASTSNFQNLSSAITYLTSASVRTDGGPANAAPFGVSGQVIFDFAAGTGPYIEQVTIPAITGASVLNNVIINGNGCTVQFAPTSTATAFIIKLSGAKHVTLDSLTVKTTSASFGWGIHFITNADSNIVKRCTIDISAVTSITSTNSAGIVFSNSTASPTTTGATGRGNLITNNTILGNPGSGGLYYGITMCYSLSTTVSANKFVNNVIQNFYSTGIYLNGSNGTLIKGNIIRNPSRTSTTTIYGIYAISSSRNDTIVGNKIHDPFGTSITTTSTFYGVYFIATNTPSTNPSVISNNIIYNVKSNGSQYGVFLSSATNVHTINNTLVFDYTLSTASSSYVTQAYYTTGATNTNGVIFKNNLVYITRGGANIKVGAFANTNGDTNIYKFDNNAYYITSGGMVGCYSGMYYSNLASWKQSNGIVFDQRSVQVDPVFVNASGADFTPTEGLLNNYGWTNTFCLDDVNGNLRGAQPDIGAYEFNAINANDASVVAVALPHKPFTSGNKNVWVTVRNNGTNSLNGVSINLLVNGVAKPVYYHAVSINPYEVSMPILIDSVDFITAVEYDLTAYTSLPNGVADQAPVNDTVYLNDNFCQLGSGTFTLDNNLPPSSTNFTSFSSFANALSGGINGPVVLNVGNTSGPYVERFQLNQIPGASTTNTININGNGRVLQFNNLVTEYSILRLNGAKHVTIDSLNIQSLSTQYGWGVHITNSADSNKILRCNIDLSSVTSISTSCVGIVFSGSFTSPTTSGAVGISNLVKDNVITGSLTGGVYYGITYAHSASTTIQYNRFLNNTIQNFYLNGIYTTGSNKCSFISNKINNTNRSGSFTSISGIYGINSCKGDTFANNLIENPFGTIVNSTSSFYGIQFATPNALSTAPVLVYNNVVRGCKSNGLQAGIYGTSCSNIKFLHNTLIFNDPASTSANTTYGMYHSGTPSGNGVEFRNNIVYINRAATNTNYNVFLVSTGTLYTFNNNVYFNNLSATNNFIGNFAGTNFQTLANWKTANSSTLDAASVLSNPLFTDISTNAKPQDGTIDNIGANLLTTIPTDYDGLARTTTPDPGAYEFTKPTVDLELNQIIIPSVPFASGVSNVQVKLRNLGSVAITSATVNWSVNGVNQTAYNWVGTLNAGATSSNILIGSYNFQGSINHTINVNVSSPNGGVDLVSLNDTASLSNVFTIIPAGTYTLDKTVASSSTNFISFNHLASALKFGGISGSVTINVVSNTGPYNEQVTFERVTGASNLNRITINGNNQEINFNNTVASAIQVIGLNNAKYYTFNNLRVKTLGTTYGVGFHLINSSDSNEIRNCNIDISSITTTSSVTNAGIAMSGSFASPASAPSSSSGVLNVFRDNMITGGATSNGAYYGIIMYASNVSNPTLSHNSAINNTIVDFYNTGIYLANSTRATIRGNTIYRQNKVSPSTFYGVFVTNGSQADTIEGNLITSPYGSIPLTYSGTTYGIYLSSTNSISTTPCLIKNNIINSFWSTGTVYGIYSSTNAYVNIYNNTINLSDNVSSNSATYGIYTTGTTSGFSVRNNIIEVNRQGAGSKYCIYIATTGTGYTINNNNLRSLPFGASAWVGYYGAVSYATLTNWKTANANAYDQNSFTTDPLFRNVNNLNFLQPGTDSLENVGFNFGAIVAKDFAGVNRSSTPDIGAYEFNTSLNDAGVLRFTQLGGNNSVSLLSALNQSMDVTLKNYGTSSLFNTTVNWSINGVLQTPHFWSGSLNKGDTVVATVGVNNFTDPVAYYIKAWTTNPNGVQDSVAINDSVSIVGCRPLTGVYTVMPNAPDTGTNFSSLSILSSVLNSCGVAGPVTILLPAFTFNQQLTFNANIPGQSSTNNITFLGVDSASTKIVHNGLGVRPTLLLNGARHFVFRNISFVTTSTSAGTAVHLYNAADSNTFVKCSFSAPVLNSSLTAVNVFVASGSLTSATTSGNTANGFLVDSSSFIGGYYGASIWGISGSPCLNNVIRNSVFQQNYQYGVYAYYQSLLGVNNNSFNLIGNGIDKISYGIAVYSSPNGFTINGNQMQGQVAGYGILLSNNQAISTSPNIVANNMLTFGSSAATTTSYAFYDYASAYTDWAHNAVDFGYLGGGNNNAAMYLYPNATNPLCTNVRIVNNIFRSITGACLFRYQDTLEITRTMSQFDNNCFYSNAQYPFATTVLAAGLNYVSATLAAWSAFQQYPNNAASVFTNPTFTSATNLRSTSFDLNNIGTPITTVPFDIDGNARSATTPDLGVSEFTPAQFDAGVIAVLQPAIPFSAGLSDVHLVIKNFGAVNLTSVNVTYQSGAVTNSLVYNGNLAPNAIDTVRFTNTSGPGSTSQQLNISAGSLSIKAYTDLPNLSTDANTLNDTLNYAGCTALSGNFTIDPLGVGANNFTSFTDAINRLICGGVVGAVTIDFANGTYIGQNVINTIPGANSTNYVLFKSATGNAANVIITSSNSLTTANYTLNLFGTKGVYFRQLTFSNTNASFGRLIRFSRNSFTNTNVDSVEFRNCIFNGTNTTSTSTVYALAFSDISDNAANIWFKSCVFNSGSYGIYLSGNSIINNATPGLVVDSSTFNNNYYMAMYNQYRYGTKFRYNNVNMATTTTAAIAIQFSNTAGDFDITGNAIDIAVGSTGIYLLSHNGYTNDLIRGRLVNNTINMRAPASTTYGLRIANSCFVSAYHNTIRLLSTSTTSAALDVSGIIGVGLTQTSTGVMIGGNILTANSGRALNIANINGQFAITYINHNLYYSTSASMINVFGTGYNKVQPIRNLVHAGSDFNSISANVSFVSATNSQPATNSTNIWAINGRAAQRYGLDSVVEDFNRSPRSILVSTGANDIGAHEVIPSTLPPLATITGLTNYDSTQAVLDYGDTVAWVTWSNYGSLPAFVNARFYPGTFISHPTQFPVNSPGHSLDAYWHLNFVGGVNYGYHIKLKYAPTLLGTIPFESDIKLSRKDTGNAAYWLNSVGAATELDTVAKTFKSNYLSNGVFFTATTDVSPLPVKLTQFTASTNKVDVTLNWKSAVETNLWKYEIEFSVNGYDFKYLTSIQAKGNALSTVAYTYSHIQAFSKLNINTIYYRLKMVDINGKFTYSNIEKVTINETHAVRVYPNPISDLVVVEFNESVSRITEFILTDVFGKQIPVKNWQLVNYNQVQIYNLNTELNSGIYILKMTVDGKTITHKLFKN